MTEKLVEPAAAVTSRLEGVKGIPNWLTVTLVALHPRTLIIMVATRVLVDVFAAKVAEMVPVPVPEDG